MRPVAATACAVALVVPCTAAASVHGGGSQPQTKRVYQASLAYARCMRAHGVPQPNPDRSGDIQLTPAQEARLRQVGRAKVQAADKICFDAHLKGIVSTKPLSAYAQARALEVLRDLKQCLHGFGVTTGNPIVRNLSRGRAMFGFDRVEPVAPGNPKRLAAAQRTCERRVRMAKRIDAIIKADRGPV